MNYTTNFELNKPEGSDFYDIEDHNENMDVIDEAMGDFYEELEDHEEILGEHDKALCRTNLLDNWYLGNAVNQRGQTSWASSYIGMTIDRWKKTGTYSGVALSSTGIKINPTGTNYVTNLLQYIDSKTYEAIKNKKITFSVVCSGVERSAGYDVQVTFMNIGTYSGSRFLYNGINSFTLQGPTGDYPTSSKPNIAISVSGSGEVNIIAVKLEVGENQTLAREVNGSVVLNDVPKYGEQLLRCKRFYQVIAGGVFPGKVRTNGESNYQLFVCLPLQVDMDESISSVMVSSSINNAHWNLADGSAGSIDGVYKATHSWIGSPNNPTNGCYYVSCSGSIESSHNLKFGFSTGLTVILSTE